MLDVLLNDIKICWKKTDNAYDIWLIECVFQYISLYIKHKLTIKFKIKHNYPKLIIKFINSYIWILYSIKQYLNEL